jgi:hypothetical protein
MCFILMGQVDTDTWGLIYCEWLLNKFRLREIIWLGAEEYGGAGGIFELLDIIKNPATTLTSSPPTHPPCPAPPPPACK